MKGRYLSVLGTYVCACHARIMSVNLILSFIDAPATETKEGLLVISLTEIASPTWKIHTD